MMDANLLTPQERERIQNTFKRLNVSFETFRAELEKANELVRKLQDDHPTLFTD